MEEGDAVTDGVETAPTLFGAEVETTGAGAVVLGTETLGAETFGGETFGGETFGGETVGGETVGGETFGGETFGGETFGGDVEPAGVVTPATGADTVGGFGTGAAGVLCADIPPPDVEALATGVEMVFEGADTVAAGVSVGALASTRGALAPVVPVAERFATDVATCADGGALPAGETVVPDADSAAAAPPGITAITATSVAKNPRAAAAASPRRTSARLKKGAVPRIHAGHRRRLPAFSPGVMPSPCLVTGRRCVAR